MAEEGDEGCDVVAASRWAEEEEDEEAVRRGGECGVGAEVQESREQGEEQKVGAARVLAVRADELLMVME